MAEFCLDCWNKTNGDNYDESKYILSDDLDLCEGCGKWKHVVVVERRPFHMGSFRMFYNIIYFMWRLIILPYLVFKHLKFKDKYN